VKKYNEQGCAALKKGFGEMTRRAPLPKITECGNKQKRTEWITSTRMMRAAYPFAVVCVLCLAHIQLQFEQSDMRAQEGKLQLRQQQLHREVTLLEKQNEMLCAPDVLKVRAMRDLNMQELQNPRNSIIAVVPVDVQDKYTVASNPDEKSIIVAELRREKQKRSLQDVVMTLLDGGRAVASVE